MESLGKTIKPKKGDIDMNLLKRIWDYFFGPEKAVDPRPMPRSAPNSSHYTLQFFELDFEALENQNSTHRFKPIWSNWHGEFKTKTKADVDALLLEACEGKIFSSTSPTPPKFYTRNNGLRETTLSVRSVDPKIEDTSLSIIVVKLSDNQHWQFNRTAAPFYNGEKSPTNGRAELFFQPTLFRKGQDGTLETEIPDQQERPRSDEYMETRWAYFICDHKTAFNDSQRPDNHFAHRFNINVEFPDDAETNPKQPIPVIIDPDIGHPGGNGGG